MAEMVKVQPPHSVMTLQDEGGDMEIDLLEVVYCLLDKWMWIVGSAIALAVLAAIVSLFALRPTYEATSKLYVLNSDDSAVNLSDLQIGSYLATDYQEVFKTWEVHEMVIANLGLDATYADMEDMLYVTNPSNTRILNITIRHKSPQMAADIANEYAAVARQYISETMSTEMPNTFSVALVATRPVSPNKTLNTIIGFIFGGIISVGIILIRFIMDDKIKSADDIGKYTDMPTLATVPVTKAIKPARAVARRRA